jgi:hypothetical protein|tara:strand:- start:39 stop:626 length:588 start_codon:yes stop_codon:yes gene_type:complete
MKRFVGYIADKIIRATPRKKKVSPDITSIGPSKTVKEKGVKASVEKAKGDEFVKRIRLKDAAEKKLKTGKEMMKAGQKERKKLIDTGRAFEFRHGKSLSAIEPGEGSKFKDEFGKKPKPDKKFKTGKELEREKKMGGGMMGRRMGYSQGSNGKPISRSKNPGILAMSKTAKGRKVVKERFKFNPDRIVAKKGGKA